MSRRSMTIAGVLLGVLALAAIAFGAFQAGVSQSDGVETARHYGAWGPHGRRLWRRLHILQTAVRPAVLLPAVRPAAGGIWRATMGAGPVGRAAVVR